VNRMRVEEVALKQELGDLAEGRAKLDRKIADALNRKKFSKDPAEVARAEGDERTLLTELDRLLTRTRAVEGKLLQVRQGHAPRF
jgi:hypothetical protein